MSFERPLEIRDLLPRPTSMVKAIMIVTAVTYVLQLLPVTGPFINTWMWLRPDDVLHRGYVWELVTYMLCHGSPMHLLINLLYLLWFGTAVEGSWGPRRFLQYYVGTGIFSGLFTFLTGAATLGASGAIFGVMVAFAMLFPDAVIYFLGIFPMRAAALVVILVALEVFAFMGMGGGGISYAAHLGGALGGFLWVKFSWRVANWMKRRPSAIKPTARRSAPRPRGGGSGPATVTALRPTAESRPAVSAEEAAIQSRADQILDKISREGMGSLSREEREILQKHSQILKSRETDVVNLDDYRP